MNYSDDVLAGYLSGDCTEELARKIDAARANDPVVREQIDALLRQDADIRDAFDQLLEVPVPVTLPEADTDNAHSTGTQEGVSSLSLWQRCAAAVALLVTGGLIGSIITSQDAQVTTPWYIPVAEYQALYGRPTLASPDASAQEREKTQTRLVEMSGMPVSIPVLAEFGLAFKRGQYLEAGGEPLIQLAYLPDSGKPFAFCFMRQAGPDTGIENATHAGLSLRHWRRDGIAYVLVGDANEPRMDSIAAHVRSL